MGRHYHPYLRLSILFLRPKTLLENCGLLSLPQGFPQLFFVA